MKKKFKVALIALAALLVIGAVAGYIAYKRIYSPNIFVKDKHYLYIHNGSDYQQVLDSIYNNFDVKDRSMLEFVANLKHYPDKVKGGRYKVSDCMSNNAFINMLRSGNQEPVNVTFNNIRTTKQLCARISKQLDIDSTVLLETLQNNDIVSKYGFNPQTVQALFIPDTYQFYWNITAEKFLDKMYGYYKEYWNEERLAKAKSIGMTPLEVSTLASIVQCEQAQHKDEQPIIAGLFINRIKQGMPLQSCPTIIYAVGDFTIKRVSGEMMKIDSPYNTYINLGLPPSPISFPETSALDAVLNYDHNDYLYMCAKADFSGYHHFSSDYNEHMHYGYEFHKALNNKGIERAE